MHGQIVQTPFSGSLNELLEQHAAQPAIPMFGHDVDALDSSRQSRPVFWAGDPFYDCDPGHPNDGTAPLDHEGQVRVAVLGHPVPEIGLELNRISLLISFHCSPGPAQARQVVGIGGVGWARRG
jgi:hypothetical protein